MKTDFLALIDKATFETHVPAARMPERNTSVYGRLKKMFSLAYDALILDIVESYEDRIVADDALKEACIRFVCLNAFIHTCRSLDVVLTATGFGIVSTESTAPASKVRVDALIEELSLELAKTSEKIIDKMITVEGWGSSRAAKRQIPTLWWRYSHFDSLAAMQHTYSNFVHARSKAIVADANLRREISEEYMEELLLKTRSGNLDNADIIVVEKCLHYFGHYVSLQEGQKPNALMVSEIVEQLESYPDSYPTYKSSRLYAKRHAERYQNRKEDPTFFFM